MPASQHLHASALKKENHQQLGVPNSPATGAEVTKFATWGLAAIGLDHITLWLRCLSGLPLPVNSVWALLILTGSIKIWPV